MLKIFKTGDFHFLIFLSVGRFEMSNHWQLDNLSLSLIVSELSCLDYLSLVCA